MELCEGMYVRTKYGIFKIRKITKDLAYWKHEKRVLELDRNIPYYNYRFSFYKDESIFKGAKFKDNIIDLIEVGDYVNGYKIYSIYDDDKYVNEYNLKHKKCLGKNIYDEDYQEYLIYEEDIETIVTKEQFESMAYKVVK